MSGWKELAKRTGVMLCYPFDERRLERWGCPVIVQPKYKGWRGRAVWREQEGRFVLLSSYGNELTSVPQIAAELRERFIVGGEPVAPGYQEFDGEVYVHGLSEEEIESLAGRKKPDAESMELEFHVFDLPQHEGQQAARFLDLLATEMHMPHLKSVPGTVEQDLDRIMEIMREWVAQGYEGIVLRHPEGLYKRTRSTQMMKFKPARWDVYRVVGAIEERKLDGTPKQALGALQVVDADGRMFKVGTGFTRQQRQDLWSRRELLLGRLVKVSYQNTSDGGMPKPGVFVEVM